MNYATIYTPIEVIMHAEDAQQKTISVDTAGLGLKMPLITMELIIMDTNAIQKCAVCAK